jgi:rhodanese-related sulfurtransferase
MENINIKQATIVDVREPFEFEMGHVEGSVNIPLGQVPEKIEELKAMAKPLVLCCASGGRSGQATQFLEINGLDDVHNGGAWNMVQMQLIK